MACPDVLLARQKRSDRQPDPPMSFADAEKAARGCTGAPGDPAAMATVLNAVVAHEQLAAQDHARLSAAHARTEQRLRGSRGARDRLLALQKQIAQALRDACAEIEYAEHEHRQALQARSHCAAKKRCMYSHRQRLEAVAGCAAATYTSSCQYNK